MIHYHGTPITPESDAVKILTGRHALVSFRYPEQLGVVASVCQSFCVDNGAFSAWKKGEVPDWNEYYAWVSGVLRCPSFDWAVIPDVIDGTEEQNDELLADWPFASCGVPVWHLHESLERLDRLIRSYDRIALGSSGSYATVGTDLWWFQRHIGRIRARQRQLREHIRVYLGCAPSSFGRRSTAV